ncbi:MAG: PEP-CTERM system histidine kinase PrsK [Steroidobacteraceae bacterium]|nr:PEP-CTERM system histidine kinase PrsK [Steroidobacteraceae bacterium]
MIVSLGLLSYGLAAGSFLLLTLLLLTSWEGRAQGVRLIVASAVTTLWAALLALGSQVLLVSVPVVLLAEVLRYGAWFVVLTGLAGSAGIASGLSRAVHVVWIGTIVLLLATPVLVNVGLPAPQPIAVLANAGLLMSLMGLVLVEQIYRNARQDGRFALKFLVIALGLMFVYDLFLFSQAQLLKGIEPASWDARGFVVLIMVPLLAIAARRNPQWSLNVFVSRHVVFYTTTFMVVGVYLLLMAGGGYLIRIYGGTWGRAAQLVFFAGAGVVLFALIASGNLRRRLRVFLNKHFYRNKYDYRIEWLRFIQTLSAPEEGVETRDNALRAIAQIIGSPGGIAFLRTEDGEEFRPQATWPPEGFDLGRHAALAASSELVGFLTRNQWVIDLKELRETPDAYQNISLPDSLADRDRFRLVVPLTHGEDLIGFAVLADPPPPFSLNYEDRDLLKTVGRHVAVHLAQYDADRRLSESRQFEAYHRLTAFVMHDLKNLAAQLALIVSNAEKHRRNPEFVDDAIGTIANSTERMQRLIDQLQRREVQSLSRNVSLANIARTAASRCQARMPIPSCGAMDDELWIEADPERLAMIVEHVIRNAQEATEEGGSIAVSVSLGGGGGAEGENGGTDAAPVGDTGQLRVPMAALTVSDSGAGMTREFIDERLFKPFDTTKGSKGMGIGAFQVREYVQSLGGRVDVASIVGQGTRFTLRIPLSDKAVPGT